MPLVITPGVTTLNKTGSTNISGAITLSEGSNITITQSGQDLSIASTGGGGSMAIGGTVTGGTATYVLFVGSGPVLAQDSAFTFDSTNDRLTVPILAGGTTNSSFLKLEAYNSTFNTSHTGRINTYHPIDLFPDNLSLSYVFIAPFFNQINFGVINFDPVIATQSGTNAIQISGYNYSPTIQYDTSQLLTNSPTFVAGAIIQPTAAVTDAAGTSWIGMQGSNSFIPSLSTAITATTPRMAQFAALPRMALAAGSHASAQAVLTNYFGFGSFDIGLITSIGANCTITNLYHHYAQSIVKDAAATITNQWGLYVEDFANGSTKRAALESAMTSGSGKWNLLMASANSAHTGNLRLGDQTAPTQKLEVLGHLLLDNSGTASELRFREPSASGSNYTAFKAQAQTGDVTYTLPAADGSSGQLLSTNGSGTLSWASAGAASQNVWAGFLDADDPGRTTTTLSAVASLSLTVTWAASTKYVFECYFPCSNAASGTGDIEFQFNGPATSAVAWWFHTVRGTSINTTPTKVTSAFATGGTTGTAIDLASATNQYAYVYGGFTTSGTPGTNPFAFEYGQVSASGTTIIQAGSYIKLTKTG